MGGEEHDRRVISNPFEVSPFPPDAIHWVPTTLWGDLSNDEWGGLMEDGQRDKIANDEEEHEKDGTEADEDGHADTTGGLASTAGIMFLAGRCKFHGDLRQCGSSW